MEKVVLVSEVCQDDLVFLTTECLNVHLHKTDSVLQINPVSSVWLLALRAQGPGIRAQGSGPRDLGKYKFSTLAFQTGTGKNVSIS